MIFYTNSSFLRKILLGSYNFNLLKFRIIINFPKDEYVINNN